VITVLELEVEQGYPMTPCLQLIEQMENPRAITGILRMGGRRRDHQDILHMKIL
jgi:hypothetical protein